MTLYVELTFAPYVNTIREISDTIRENNVCTLRENTLRENTTLYVKIFHALYVNTLRENIVALRENN